MIDHNKRPRQKRKARIRKIISGTQNRPRIAVFRSNMHVYAQIIDDTQGKTLVAISEKELESAPKNKIERAEVLGKLLAQKAQSLSITTCVFDRGGFAYHGRIEAFAKGLREGGLQF